MRSFLLGAGLALLNIIRASAEPVAEAAPAPSFVNICVRDPANIECENQAGIPDYIKGSYFVHTGYVFAINAVKANGDVWYHMNAPTSHSWYGVGFGRDMNNVRMLVAYLGSNGHNVTNSCRMSYGESEPVYDPDCVVDDIYGDIYGPYANTLSPGGVMITHSVCRGCASWMGGALDLNSTEQPFIYALGPNTTLLSDRRDAEIRMHTFHGVFNLDMTKATNYTGTYGRVPAPQDPANQGQGAFWAFANAFSSPQYNFGDDTEWAGMAHGIFMCIAFLLIFPLGAVILRTMKRAMFHAVAQLVGFLFVLVGFALAVYVSKIYNKSKKFNSAHQVIGLLVLATLFIQIGLGFTHHFLYLRTGHPTPMGQIHRFLGIGIIVLSVVNAGVGWNFAGNSANNAAYGAVAGVMGLIFVGFFFLLWRANRKTTTYKAERLSSSFVPHDYKEDAPSEYEMHHAPFASMGQPHAGGNGGRTPRWMESNDSLRNLSTRGTEGYSDNPATMPKHVPYHTQWQPVSGP